MMCSQKMSFQQMMLKNRLMSNIVLTREQKHTSAIMCLSSALFLACATTYVTPTSNKHHFCIFTQFNKRWLMSQKGWPKNSITQWLMSCKHTGGGFCLQVLVTSAKLFKSELETCSSITRHTSFLEQLHERMSEHHGAKCYPVRGLTMHSWVTIAVMGMLLHPC